MFKELQIVNSYTLESTFYSFYHPKISKKKYNIEDDQQIKEEDLLGIGNDFCTTLV